MWARVERHGDVWEGDEGARGGREASGNGQGRGAEVVIKGSQLALPNHPSVRNVYALHKVSQSPALSPVGRQDRGGNNTDSDEDVEVFYTARGGVVEEEPTNSFPLRMDARAQANGSVEGRVAGAIGSQGRRRVGVDEDGRGGRSILMPGASNGEASPPLPRPHSPLPLARKSEILRPVKVEKLEEKESGRESALESRRRSCSPSREVCVNE